MGEDVDFLGAVFMGIPLIIMWVIEAIYEWHSIHDDDEENDIV